ncbi:MAG: hypothetical protein BGO01_09080 [Armatimonadetes bacterium 55-13]|nr:hypothetical protein [Armatimonadota bacterium]OJU62165.1 MAG: hypothetical protein BGO01_09080 [Armatimonadetes bacterium 55-13]
MRDAKNGYDPLALVLKATSLLAFCLVALAFVLNRHTTQLDLASSRILYAPEDLASTQIGQWANANFGVKLIDVQSDESRKIAKDYAFEKYFQVPLLLLKSRGGVQRIYGEASIAKTLESYRSSQAPTELGIKGCLLSLLVLTLVFSASRMVTALGVLLPIFSITALSLTLPTCSTCNVFIGLPTWLPYAAGLSISAAMIVLLYLGGQPRTWTIFACVCTLALAIQATLLFISPKVCATCLSVTAVLGSAIVFADRLRKQRIVRTLRFSAKRPLTAVLSFVAIALLSASWRTGSANSGNPIYSASFLGSKASDLGVRHKSCLVVVYLSGCHACEDAEKSLREHRIPYQRIQLCSLVNGGPCFQYSGPFQAPTFLIVDRNGFVSYDNSGWPPDPNDQMSLCKELAQRLERNK